jgi:hypothetical protein
VTTQDGAAHRNEKSRPGVRYLTGTTWSSVTEVTPSRQEIQAEGLALVNRPQRAAATDGRTANVTAGLSFVSLTVIVV